MLELRDFHKICQWMATEPEKKKNKANKCNIIIGRK